MSLEKLKMVFGKEKGIVLPVIHVENFEQALRNVKICRDAGADGCFLINHSSETDAFRLNEIHIIIRNEIRDFWIGVNFLDLDPLKAFILFPRILKGLWSDDAQIEENPDIIQERATKIRNQEILHYWDTNFLYFGGVAFKYRKEVRDLKVVSRIAKRYVDVITTSGPATGIPAEIAKIKTIRESINNFPLAIASGITSENIRRYMPYANCFLVATGISKSFIEIDPYKLKNLLGAVV